MPLVHGIWNPPELGLSYNSFIYLVTKSKLSNFLSVSLLIYITGMLSKPQRYCEIKKDKAHKP